MLKLNDSVTPRNKLREYATPGQYSMIARLTAALNIDEPRVIYYGEAGRIIRKLELEIKTMRKTGR